MTPTTIHNRTGERGNALFLILIAVALFAALSYAVTQSGRGSGDINREQGQIMAAQLTQYPSALRSTVTRMVLTGSEVTDINFVETDGGANARDEVFGSDGGAMMAQDPPSNAVTTDGTISGVNAGPDWRYKSLPATNGWFISGIGQSTGKDSFAFIGLTKVTCQSVNRGLGLLAPASEDATDFFDTTECTGTVEGDPSAGHTDCTIGADETTATAVIGKGVAASADGAQAFACVSNAADEDGPYVYYHALYEQ